MNSLSTNVAHFMFNELATGTTSTRRLGLLRRGAWELASPLLLVTSGTTLGLHWDYFNETPGLVPPLLFSTPSDYLPSLCVISSVPDLIIEERKNVANDVSGFRATS